MEFDLFLGLIGLVLAFPVILAVARDRPAASWAMILAWSFGLPLVGWFIGLYLALQDE